MAGIEKSTRCLACKKGNHCECENPFEDRNPDKDRHIHRYCCCGKITGTILS